MSDDSAPLVLSPTRAQEFKNCPQLFKFRYVDQLPEPADLAGTRGTLLHLTLERLFDLPASQRALPTARTLLAEAWGEIRAVPEFADSQMAPDVESSWLQEADGLLVNYFALERPFRVMDHQTELWVEHTSERLTLRGIIDRAEPTEGGAWILTDYKTGHSPPDTYALGAFFGLKFYALVLMRNGAGLATTLRLLHLAEPESLTIHPTESMLDAFEKQLEALGVAIGRAFERDDWRPRPSRLCDWCPHRSICPAFN